jgi:oxygen-independent coproporphyrinogen III oxidase
MPMHNVSSLYVHFPFCRHLCNYCDFYKLASPDVVEYGPFHSYLIKATAFHQRFMQEHKVSWSDLDTLYIGGGTPSLWDKDGASFFFGLLKTANIGLRHDAEFTMEINPGTISSESLAAWERHGLNRYSIGLQSLSYA